MTTTVKIIAGHHPVSVNRSYNRLVKNEGGDLVAIDRVHTENFVAAGAEAHFHVSTGEFLSVTELPAGATGLVEYPPLQAVSDETTKED